MKTSRVLSRLLVLFLLLACIALVCSSVYQTALVPTATPTPTFTPIPSSTPTLLPTVEPAPDTGWYWVQPGMERRSIRLYNDQNQQIESLYLLRLDPNQFRFDVAFDETALSLETWQTRTNALVVLNGGYFRIENNRHFPNGLTIVNGGSFGSSYDSFAGMLAISDEAVELRWLAEKPYDPGEPLRAALQSFPLLVKPGGELGFPAQYEDNLKARRTVIGQDWEGRILLLVAPQGYFTLHQLSLYLTESDLQLHIALNLDGGPSSGILLADPPESIPSQSLLPFVILVHARE